MKQARMVSTAKPYTDIKNALIRTEMMKTIYIYPSPETVGKVLLKDKADNCFYFEEQIVECPADESKISSVPMQS